MTPQPQQHVETRAPWHLRRRLALCVVAFGVSALIVGCGRGPRPVLLPDEVLLVSLDELSAEIAAPPATAPSLAGRPAFGAHPTAQDAVDDWASRAAPFVQGDWAYSGQCQAGGGTPGVDTPGVNTQGGAGNDPAPESSALCVSPGPIPDVYYLGPGESEPWYVIGVQSTVAGSAVTEILRGRG